jgi:hypothetical protein
MPSYSENANHQAVVMRAEAVRQAAIASALASGEASTTILPSGTPQNGLSRAIKAADAAFNKTCLASALANGLSPSVYMTALRELGC